MTSDGGDADAGWRVQARMVEFLVIKFVYFFSDCPINSCMLRYYFCNAGEVQECNSYPMVSES